MTTFSHQTNLVPFEQASVLIISISFLCIFGSCETSFLYRACKRHTCVIIVLRFTHTIQQSVIMPYKEKNLIMTCLDWLASGSSLLIGSFNSASLSRVTQYRVKCSTDWAPQTTWGQGEVGGKIEIYAARLGNCYEHVHITRTAAICHWGHWGHVLYGVLAIAGFCILQIF